MRKFWDKDLDMLKSFSKSRCLSSEHEVELVNKLIETQLFMETEYQQLKTQQDRTNELKASVRNQNY